MTRAAPPRPFVRPAADDSSRFEQWLAEYTNQPHPELGRSGPVCPFTAAMARADALITYAYPWPDRAGQRTLTAVVRRAVEVFHTAAWPRAAPANLHAMVVLMPDLPQPAWPLLDDAQATVKGQAVSGGLMLGQFHPSCRQPAVHNADFREVSQSPMPMLAVRRMAVHDVLFLDRRPVHFAAYHRRFGHLYATGQAPASLADLYDRACSRNRLPAAPERWSATPRGGPQ